MLIKLEGNLGGRRINWFVRKWDLSLGGLNDKRMRENLRRKVRVASPQKTKG